MRTFLIVLVLLLTSLPMEAVTPVYNQVYTIFIKGVPAGTESLTEEQDKNGNTVSTSESEIVVSDGVEAKKMVFKTRLVLSKGSLYPVSYSSRYTSGNSDGYEVSVKNGSVTRVLTRGGRVSESATAAPPDLVIVDFNVYHHFDYLVRKYDAKKGGRQSFQNFIPLPGSTVALSITPLEDSKQDFPKGSVEVRNYKVEVAGFWSGGISMDKHGRLVRLVAPNQEVEVIRRDLLPDPLPAPSEEKKDAGAEKKPPH